MKEGASVDTKIVVIGADSEFKETNEIEKFTIKNNPFDKKRASILVTSTTKILGSGGGGQGNTSQYSAKKSTKSKKSNNKI